jgi:hypothetical protein
MSVKQLNAVFENSRAEGAAYTVAIAMADWADHAGWCYPSYSQIMQKAHIKSRATVLTALDKLEELGELKIFPKGHAPTVEDDDVAPPVARQFRNLYRLTILKPRSQGQVVQPLNHLDTQEVDQPLNQHEDAEVVQLLNHLDSEVDQSLNGGGSTIEPGGSSILDAHIRNSPSVLSVNEPSAAAAAAADDDELTTEEKNTECEVFRCTWNNAIVPPLPPVDELTPSRRQRILAALNEQPFMAWQVIFARVAKSSFLRGGGDRGFVANLWWLIEKPERAIAVMEGQYDDPPKKKLAIRL